MFTISIGNKSHCRIKMGCECNFMFILFRLFKLRTLQSLTWKIQFFIQHTSLKTLHYYRFQRVLFSAVNKAIHYLIQLFVLLQLLIIVTAGWRDRQVLLEFSNEVIYLRQIPAEGRQTYFPSAPFFQRWNNNNYFALFLFYLIHTHAQWPKTHFKTSGSMCGKGQSHSHWRRPTDS